VGVKGKNERKIAEKELENGNTETVVLRKWKYRKLI